MFNAVFTQLLLAALAVLLVVAAVIDVRTFTISNRLNLTVALLAPLYWLSVALSPWPGVTVKFLVLMSIAGGVLTLAILVWHRAKRREGRPQIPYGVAIAFGGLAI